jgi:hypothetical protein
MKCRSFHIDRYASHGRPQREAPLERYEDESGEQGQEGQEGVEKASGTLCSASMRKSVC